MLINYTLSGLGTNTVTVSDIKVAVAWDAYGFTPSINYGPAGFSFSNSTWSNTYALTNVTFTE